MGAMAGDPAKPFVLEGMVSALNVMRVLSSDLQAIDGALELKIVQSPVLFKGAPVVIDVSALEPDPNAEPGAAHAAQPSLAALNALLKRRGLVPVGAYARSDARMREAAEAGLPFIDARRRGRPSDGSRKPQPWPDQERPRSEAAPQRAPAATPAAPAAAPAAPENHSALMLTQPLRAGQIVHAEHRDAVALAAVNSGAELIADGNIHVYATLRGRALAGARGNEQARIFCQKLEADLISIAGVYLSADDLPADKVGKPVQVSLKDGELVLSDLTPR